MVPPQSGVMHWMPRKSLLEGFLVPSISLEEERCWSQQKEWKAGLQPLQLEAVDIQGCRVQVVGYRV